MLTSRRRYAFRRRPTVRLHRVYPRSKSRSYRTSVPRRVLRGRGGYWSDAVGFLRRAIPRGSFARWGGNIGQVIGGAYGNPGVGRYLGGGLGQIVSNLTGMGAYKVKANTLMNAAPPAIQNSYVTRVRHREYIGEVESSVLFNSQYVLNINPGLPNTFPWLSTIAQCYEQYKIHGMIFYFKSTSANALNSTNTALGEVNMATDYNAGGTDYNTKEEFENSEFASSGKPSTDIVHPIECAVSQTPQTHLYVRQGAPPSAAYDLRLYDLGKFQLATGGSQAAATIGSLYVSYDIEFFKPVLPEAQSSLTSHFGFQSPADATPMGTGYALYVDQLGITVNVPSLYIEFPVSAPVGRYVITYAVTGTVSANCIVPALTYGTDFTLATILNVGYVDASSVAAPSGGSGQSITLSRTVVVDVAYGVDPVQRRITFAAGQLPTGNVWGDLIITYTPGLL